MIYKCAFTLTEKMLASSPQDPKVYEQFIAARKRSDAEDRGDEVASLPAEEIEKIGSSVFHRDETGLFMFDYRVRGFLKEAAAAVVGKDANSGGVSAFKSKIDKWVFAAPRRIYLYGHNGASKKEADGIHEEPDKAKICADHLAAKVIQTPHGTEERPVRAMTAQGPRTSLKRSEYVDAGTTFECNIIVLPLGERDFNENRLNECFSYGKFCGFGEWRTASFGRFEYTLTKIGDGITAEPEKPKKSAAKA